MIYVLKTRSVTGHLVPLNGEHIEYDKYERAYNDAKIWATVHNEPVSLVDFLFGDVVEVVW